MDSYLFIDGEYEIKNEVKRSLFIASAKGEVDSSSAEEFVKSLKKKYPDATHHCYAYICDDLGNVARFSDDGEPSGTAGQPILDVLKKQKLKKSAIVVTRYFGGIKLGASGLVGAYSSAAADVVRAANISEKKLCKKVDIASSYADYQAIDSYLRRSQCKVDDAQFDDSANISVCVPVDSTDKFFKDILELTAGRVQVAFADLNEYVKI